MQLIIELKDESKLDFLLQFFREVSFVNVLSVQPSDSSGKKKFTAEQQRMVDDFMKEQAARNAGDSMP